MKALKSILNNILSSSLFIVISPLVSFTQENDENKALTVNVTSTNDFMQIVTGTGSGMSGYLGHLDLSAELTTDKVWKNGRFMLYAIQDFGFKPSGDFIGDLQVISNIEADNHIRLYELYYEHNFTDNISLLIGQHNVNTDFAVADHAATFLNSSFGIQPDISLNNPVSIFPNTAFGARLKWNITKNVTFQTVFSDGYPGDDSDNAHGVNWKFTSNEGFINLTEIHYNLYNKSGEQTGSYKLGTWYGSQEYPDPLDANLTKEGNMGFYFIADQKLFSEKNDNAQGLSAFVQLGIAPSEFNYLSPYTGLGFSYTGMFKKRAEDVIGIAMAKANLHHHVIGAANGELEKFENTIEFTYQMNINENLNILADLQYIINPGAIKTNANTLASSIRLIASF